MGTKSNTTRMVASIIITTWNRPELLKRALKSARSQTFKDYEVIVVDDCSDIPVEGAIRHEVNKGLSAARNTGIKVAKGKYVVFLDDDNELMPEFLSQTVPILEAKHFVDSIEQQLDAVAVGRTIQYKDFTDYVVPKTDLLSSIDWGWLVKREVFDSIRYTEHLRANEDTDFGIQFFKRFKAIQLDEPLTIAHDSEDPKQSLSFPTKRELEGMLNFYAKNRHEYKNSKEIWCLQRLMGRKFYRGGYKLQGLRYFWWGFKAYPAIRSFLHLFFLLFGWTIYDKFMTAEEKLAAKLR